MKIIPCIVALLIVIVLMEMSYADDGTNVIAMKRPFCNAFTGCGRKRDPAYASAPSFQLPLLLYRDLLRLAAARSAGAAAEDGEQLRLRQRLGLEQHQAREEQQPPPPPPPPLARGVLLY